MWKGRTPGARARRPSGNITSDCSRSIKSTIRSVSVKPRSRSKRSTNSVPSRLSTNPLIRSCASTSPATNRNPYGSTVRRNLAEQAEHVGDLDAIIVVDDEGRLVDDISVGELFVAEPDTRLAELIGPPWPVTVTADADVREMTDRLIDSRRLSIVVLDDDDRPLGRIMVDDVLDAVMASRRRWQLPGARWPSDRALPASARA